MGMSNNTTNNKLKDEVLNLLSTTLNSEGAYATLEGSMPKVVGISFDLYSLGYFLDEYGDYGNLRVIISSQEVSTRKSSPKPSYRIYASISLGIEGESEELLLIENSYLGTEAYVLRFFEELVKEFNKSYTSINKVIDLVKTFPQWLGTTATAGKKKKGKSLSVSRPPLEVPEYIPPVGSVWRHVKSGTHYIISDFVYIEATASPSVTYFAEGGSVKWVRPLSEFLDGRFELVVG